MSDPSYRVSIGLLSSYSGVLTEWLNIPSDSMAWPEGGVVALVMPLPPAGEVPLSIL
jgi:hypothetical protein